MKRSPFLFAILSVTLLATASVFAQSAAPVAAPAAMSASRLVLTANGWRASKVIGSTVYNEAGETIGMVDDIILDDKSRATDVILSVGGFLGIGAKLVKVPYSQLRFDQSTTTVTTMTTVTNTVVGGVAAGTAGNTTTSTSASATPSTGTGAPQNNTTTSAIRLVMPSASKDQLTQMQTFSYP